MYFCFLKKSNTLHLMLFEKVKYFLLLILSAASVQMEARTLTFRQQTMDDGLSNFVVTSFYKDSVGFMWIGTDVGLDRFDGVEYRHYSFAIGDVNKRRVRAIVETQKGNLFVGNSIGLWKLNNTTDKLEQVSPSVIDAGVNALLWDASQKSLFIGTEKGLFVMEENKSIRFFSISSNVLSLSNSITGLVSDDSGIVWISTRNGLCRFESSRGKVELFLHKTDNAHIAGFNKITRIGSTIYLGTDNSGLIRFDLDTHLFSKWLDVGSNIITDISSDGVDNIYVATDGNGVHFFSHSKQYIVESFRYDPNGKGGIRSNSVYSLLVDRDGVIWAGFYQAGFDYSLYQNNVFQVYQFPPYFDSYGLPVRAFVVRDGEMVIGTRAGLYFVNETTRQFKSYGRDVLRSNLILSVKYHKGKYYIGTYGGGVSVLNPLTMSVEPFNDMPVFVKGHIFHFDEDAEGRLWIATSDGAFVYDKELKTIRHFSSTNSQLLKGNVFYVFFDSSNKGWLATENGLSIYDPVSGIIKNDVFPAGFFNKEIIKVIYEDSQKRLFFCPDKGNVLVSDLDMRNASELATTSRFKGRIFLSVLEDAQRNYWFGSDNGLLNMDIVSNVYHSYGFADGIPDNVFNTDAIYQDKSTGRVWFGNAKGLLYADTEMFSKMQKKQFPLVLSDFQVNGTSLAGKIFSELQTAHSVKLKYNDNNLKIKFVSLSYTSPNSVVYEYKLDGFDTEWQVLSGNQNEVSYSKVPTGNYIFRVRTECNEESELELNVSIGSFFSLTFWLVAIAVALLLYLLTNKLLHFYKKLIDNIAALTANLQHSLEAESNRLDEKYRNVNLPDKECEQIVRQLNEFMLKEKVFTNPDLKINDLANSLGLQSHILSYVFNQHLKKSYYDFVNEYRILAFKKLVMQADSSKYTLSAMAERCGFSSRASFFRSFKKLTGITPNEYIKSVGAQLSEIIE